MCSFHGLEDGDNGFSGILNRTLGVIDTGTPALQLEILFCLFLKAFCQPQSIFSISYHKE